LVEKKGRFIVPIFITYQGCPHKCVYCKQEDITGVSNALTEDEIKEIVSKAIGSKKYSKAKVREIAFYGGTFTNLDKEEILRLLRIVRPYINSYGFDSIRISTRPDKINPSILGLLKNHKVETIEIGVQSLDDKVLKASGRGHSSEDCIYAAKLIKEYGFRLGIQLMLGLPMQDEKSFLETIQKVIDLSPEFVRIYPTIVIKGTALESLLLDGRYTPLTIQETIRICSKAVEMLEVNNISVIRIGLMNSQILEANYVAGPYHPSLGHMIRCRVFLERLSRLVNKKDFKTHTFKIPKDKAALFWGHKGEGLRILKGLTGATNIRVLKERGELEVRLEF